MLTLTKLHSSFTNTRFVSAMLFERSLVFVQKTLIDFEQKVQKLRLHKYHAISKVFRVWESFHVVRIRKITEIGLSGFTNGRLGVGATNVMELDSVLKNQNNIRQV